jgi:thymidylate kinase
MRFIMRLFARWIFIADLVLVWMTIRALRGNGIALIFDRYAYDALVQLRHVGVCGDGFFKRWARLIPKPDLAFLLRTRPEVAHERRPEYSIEECASKFDLYRRLTETICFCVVDAENEKRAREEVRGIMAYAERNW